MSTLAINNKKGTGMKLQEALKLLKNSGYLCEFTVAAEPTFDDYKNKVYKIVADQVGQERADMIIEYEERELQDYAMMRFVALIHSSLWQPLPHLSLRRMIYRYAVMRHCVTR